MPQKKPRRVAVVCDLTARHVDGVASTWANRVVAEDEAKSSQHDERDATQQRSDACRFADDRLIGRPPVTYMYFW